MSTAIRRKGQRTPKDARLALRTTPEMKEMIERAAEYTGVSVTEFVVANIAPKAAETVRTHELIQLSARDSLAFAEALLNSGEPNEKLRAAYARYRALVREE